MVNSLLANSYDFGPWMMGIGAIGAIVILALAVLVLLLKGYSLWYAAKRDEKWWFIALLVINTMGILELVYLIFVVKKWPKIYSGKKATPTQTPPTPAV